MEKQEKIELKKLSDIEWEIPKTGRMNVPGKIFISEKMLKNTEQSALKQVMNVATLPGIIKYSFAMPDIHWGYGFPIGGVAAFDAEKGIVSPGGVGYDINCLTGDSKILTEFGASINIEEFEKLQSNTEIEQNGLMIKKALFGINLPTINLKNKSLENKNINLFMHKESNDVHEIELYSGLKIKATSDHPFLTKEGMKPLSKLSENDKLAINLFEGVESNVEIDEKLAIISKILGYLFGDGCCYQSKGKYYGVAYGNREDLETMQADLKRLSINSSIYPRMRKHKIQTKYGTVKFTATNHELHIYSQDFLRLLEKLGMPQGNKTRNEVKLPEWIKKSNKIIKRLFLAGFFGAEMSSPKTSSKTCFYCPRVDQNKIESLSQNMRDFLIDISLMLEEFGIKTMKITESEDFHNKYGEKTRRFRLILNGDNKNLLKLYRNLGFEYNLKRQKLANIAALYILLKYKENKKRQDIAAKVKAYRQKGLKLKEIKKIFENKINTRFIERHYYENAGQRINLDFISFNEFCKQKLKELQNFGVIFDGIKNIKRLEGRHKVHDFNIQDNHNFIANGFVVSNCGVRLLATDIKAEEFMKKRQEVLHALFRSVPAGVGRGFKVKHTKDELIEVMKKGSEWALENGAAEKEDIERTEEYGRMKEANPDAVSQRAIARGLGQLGTLGAGNHFLDIQVVDEIYDEDTAKAFELKKGNICIMIHCGSRGLGHQIASDYIKTMEDEFGWKNLPDRELINAPIKSELGRKYLGAMACAVNFAFCNRQIIMHHVREQLKHYFPKAKINLVYDVAHNIAKFEKHFIDGKEKEVLIMRKGATRSFGKGRKEIPSVYRKIGQPVLIPGTMATPSFVLLGTKEAEEKTFGSTAHGAGRVKSRTQARKEHSYEEIKKELEKRDILLEAIDKSGVLEEFSTSYKDVEEVVRVSHEAGIGKLVAKLVPKAVMIG